MVLRQSRQPRDDAGCQGARRDACILHATASPQSPSRRCSPKGGLLPPSLQPILKAQVAVTTRRARNAYGGARR